jgi:ribosomal protein S6
MDTRVYELSFLLSGRLNEADSLALFDKIEKVFNDFGGQTIKKSALERKILTYPVKKQKEAYFCYLHMELDPEKLLEIQEKFRYENDILRSLCLTPPPNFGKMTNVGGKQKAKDAKEKKEVEGAAEIKEESFDVTQDKSFDAAQDKKEKIDLEDLDQKLEEIKDLA